MLRRETAVVIISEFCGAGNHPSIESWTTFGAQLNRATWACHSNNEALGRSFHMALA